MKKKKMHKNTLHVLLDKIFFSPFKCREITFCRKKKKRVECNHTEVHSGPAIYFGSCCISGD